MRERSIELGDVIPAPAEVWPDPAGGFTVGPGTGIRTDARSDVGGAGAVAEQLAGLLRLATGYPIPVSGTAGEIVIELTTGAEGDRGRRESAGDTGEGERGRRESAGDTGEGDRGRRESAGDTGEGDRGGRASAGDTGEGYELTVSPAGMAICARTPAGLFAAVQTIRQMVPVQGRGDVTIPGGRIADRPRFAYRGVMLDVARHHFASDEVKAYIDAIAQFKINHLHLHLTDDQGWRIEIKSWPELTAVGGGPGTGVDGAGPGFYTQDEYADLVAYAATRFVTIVPEIDMPGHANAAQAAYPELAPGSVAVAPRTDLAVGYSSLVVGSPRTYTFVEDVLREVAALTPGPYLHIGGDEADATTPADYRAFMARVLPLVARYGKRAIGWHEMAAVDLPPGAVAQYWRIEPADDGVARAAAHGNQVIMSPADRTYLDMKYAADSPLGLDWAGLIDIERAYDWDPADRLPGVGEPAVLGVEAALWSETLRGIADVQVMTFPRLLAIAEIGWSPRAARSWESFRRRLATFGPRWTAQGIAYHRSPKVDWD